MIAAAAVVISLENRPANRLRFFIAISFEPFMSASPNDHRFNRHRPGRGCRWSGSKYSFFVRAVNFGEAEMGGVRSEEADDAGCRPPFRVRSPFFSAAPFR